MTKRCHEDAELETLAVESSETTRVRAIFGTWNNWTSNDYETLKKYIGKNATWAIVGKEVGDKENTPHLQYGICFKNARTLKSCRKALTGSDVRQMKGTPEQVKTYCTKQDKDAYEFGEMPKQGTRTDLNEVKERILSGQAKADDICVENPEFFHQYGRTLDRLEGIALRKKFRQEMTEGIWITGPTGCGKSHMAMEDFSPETHYIKNLNEDWWDGYTGQETVILNEFRGQIKFSELLDMVDKWPKTVKWRGRESVPFLAKKLIITSIKTPEEVYVNTIGEPWAQFERRFKMITITERPE